MATAPPTLDRAPSPAAATPQDSILRPQAAAIEAVEDVLYGSVSFILCQESKIASSSFGSLTLTPTSSLAWLGNISNILLTPSRSGSSLSQTPYHFDILDPSIASASLSGPMGFWDCIGESAPHW